MKQDIYYVIPLAEANRQHTVLCVFIKRGRYFKFLNLLTQE